MGNWASHRHAHLPDTVKSQDKVAPLPLSRTVRVGPIGRMGRSEFIALLKRVGPLASYWWDGAHVVARFEKAGDAKDAVQTCRCLSSCGD